MSENNVTLSDLSNGAVPTAAPVGMPPRPRLNTANVREANLKEVVLPSEADKPVEGTGNPMLDAAFKGLDTTIERLNQESTALYQQGQEERIQEAIDNDTSIDDEDEDMLTSSTSNVIKVNNFDDIRPQEHIQIQQPTVQSVHVEKQVDVSAPVAGTEKKNISIVQDTSIYDDEEDDHLFDGIDEEDMKFLDDDEDTSDEVADKTENDEEKAKNEAIRQTIRAQINQNFNPVSKKLDLSSFSISKKPINASKVINEIKAKAIECADGVLYHEKKAIRMSAWKPMEIQSIDPQRIRGGQSNYNKFIENKLKLIYDHIIDANKPKSFEAWTMITPNTVMDDYMFTSYKATFGTANIITFTCPDEKCNNVFMENVPVHSMIKFTNDEVKEEYMRILHEGNTDSQGI